MTTELSVVKARFKENHKNVDVNAKDINKY